MPADRTDEVTALENENERLKVSLRRCHALVAACRSKLAANSNGDYRPPYASDDRGEGQQQGAHGSE